MTQLDGTGMKRLHREWRRRTDGRLALVLDQVANPFNVGAIVRTAAGSYGQGRSGQAESRGDCWTMR